MGSVSILRFKTFLAATLEGLGPTVVVLSKSAREGERLVSNPILPNNMTDIVFLYDSLSSKVQDDILIGRSFPLDFYVQKYRADDNRKCCYILPGFYRGVWIKGWHPTPTGPASALVQRGASVDIGRSKDGVFFNEEDWFNRDVWVGCNFHGAAPWSAGCVTVRGGMSPPSLDWAVAHKWYGRYPANQKFNLLKAFFPEESDKEAVLFDEIASFIQTPNEGKIVLTKVEDDSKLVG